jgi:preprotein translocase subunit SecA
MILIGAIDENWQKHLTEMEALRSSVGLRGYGQRDPINEYRKEAFEYFEAMLRQINSDVCMKLFRSAGSPKAFNKMISELHKRVMLSGGNADANSDADSDGKQPKIQEAKPKITIKQAAIAKVHRNDLCPCGSGKKYKKCCGAK